jgi:hypothetical protein
MGRHTLEACFGLAGRDGFADLELPLPQPRLNLQKGEYNALAGHDFDFARRFLKRAKFPLLINVSMAALLWLWRSTTLSVTGSCQDGRC